MIYVILGPTGSGKTGCVEKIVDYLNDPLIVNADAFQIYKDMNIGTAKIRVDDPLYDRYKLLDILTPDKSFSIQEYQTMFRKLLSEIDLSKRDVVIVGGSGLYVKSALYDYQFVEYEDDFDESQYEQKTNEELHEILQQLDKVESEKIHPNNRKRVLQAIRISSMGKGAKSEQIASQKHELLYKNVVFLCLNPDRETLYENINKRVDMMINDGLVEEVKGLLDKYELSKTAYQAIGYKEIIEYLLGKTSLEDAIESVKKRTRNYAKRQMTFFKHQLPCIMYNSREELINNVVTKGTYYEKRY